MVSLAATLKMKFFWPCNEQPILPHKQPLSCLLNILRLDDLSIESFTVS